MNKVSTYYRTVLDLPKDLSDLVKSFCNPYDEYYEEQIEHVIKQYGINHVGFIRHTKTFSIDYSGNRIISNCNDFSKSDYKNIIKCKCEVLSLYKPLKSAGKYDARNDYTGKADIEIYRSFKKDSYTYISSGEHIVALILAGYTPILTKGDYYKSSRHYAVKRNTKTGLPIHR